MAGNGSIERRGKNSFRLTVSCGFDGAGNRIVHRKTVKVKGKSEEKQLEEAQKELVKFTVEIEEGQHYGSSKMKLSAFVEQFLDKYGKEHLAPKTLTRYKDILQGRVVPALGHHRLVDLRPMHLLDFYNDLQQNGIRKDEKKGTLSPQTIRHHHRVLHTLFAVAVQWGTIKDNPAARVQAPKVPKKDAGSYDEEQTAALLSALEKEPLEYLKHKVAVMLALTTGARRGEIMGLEWKDIDFDAGTLKIERSSQYVEGYGIITKEPKNESSKRVIPLTLSMIKLLKKYETWQKQERLRLGAEWEKEAKEHLGDAWEDNDRLFRTWNGSPAYPGSITHWFKDFLERHDLPPLPFHGLRHTAATLLIGAGTQDLTVAALLGHSDPGTTKRIYAHSLKSAERAAADMMESIVSSKAAK